jgi:hypothetical protein
LPPGPRRRDRRQQDRIEVWDETFSAEEKAAMKEAARERRAQKSGKVDGAAEVAAKIAAGRRRPRDVEKLLPRRRCGARPEVRTWYGMPAYAKDGKVVWFFQDAAKSRRVLHSGFQDPARSTRAACGRRRTRSPPSPRPTRSASQTW